jgi:CO dehydrogenase maturation factor
MSERLKRNTLSSVMMKLAIAGKGGVGKTTLAAILSILYRDEGRNVLAIDADSNPNLSMILGIPSQEAIPLTERKELIEKRTKATMGGFGAVFKLNPRVDDIEETYAVEKEGIHLLVMGTVTAPESGCACPANVLVKRLLSHILLTEKDVVICDLEAGVEHLGRGTAKAVDAMIIVVEPGQRSVETANRIFSLGDGLGIIHVYAVGNKVRTEEEKNFLKESLSMDVLGFIPHDGRIREADMKGEPPLFDDLLSEIASIKENLEKRVNKK